MAHADACDSRSLKTAQLALNTIEAEFRDVHERLHQANLRAGMPDPMLLRAIAQRDEASTNGDRAAYDAAEIKVGDGIMRDRRNKEELQSLQIKAS